MSHSDLMTLDPIVSLSVALAESPGTCAFFLGSGVSRDAGVPTGGEVLRDGLRRLHQVENPGSDALDDTALDAWLRNSGRNHMQYSEVLDLIAPDQAVRRASSRRSGIFMPRASRQVAVCHFMTRQPAACRENLLYVLKGGGGPRLAPQPRGCGRGRSSSTSVGGSWAVHVLREEDGHGRRCCRFGLIRPLSAAFLRSFDALSGPLIPSGPASGRQQQRGQRAGENRARL